MSDSEDSATGSGSGTMLSRKAGITELRAEVPSSEVSVLDGVCSATGRGRTEVIREILSEWSKRRLHEASVICRVAGVNPMRPDGGRNES